MILYSLRKKFVLNAMKFLTPGIFANYKIAMLNLDTINYMPRPMIKYLAQLNMSDLVGAEVGVSQGENALNMFQVLNIKRLYAVDPYVPYFEDTVDNRRVNKNGVNKIHVDFKESAHKNLEGKPVVWLHQFSVDAAKEVVDSLDFVYIDACHDYANIKADIEAWYPLVRVGGVFGGHDFNCCETGIIKAVTEFVNAKKIHLNIVYPDWFVVKEK